jgi:WD40 repeat protein
MIDPSKAKLVKRITGATGFWSAALDPSENRLFCGGSDFGIHLFDAAALPDATQAVLKGHRSYVTALAHSASAKTTISGGFDRTLLGWKTGAETPSWRAEPGALIQRLAVSPDGTLVASAQDDLTVRLWDPATGKLVRTLAGQHAPTTAIGRQSVIYAVAFSPDGKRLASGDRVGGVCLWEVETGKPLAKLDAGTLYSQAFFRNTMPPSEYEWGGCRSLAFSPDGKLLFAGGMGPADQNSAGIDGLMRIEVFDVETGKSVHAVTLEKSKGLLTGMLVDPSGRWLAATGGGGGAGAGGSGTLCFWDYRARDGEGKPVAPVIHPSVMVCRDLVFAPGGGRVLVVGMEKSVTAGRIELWEL